MHKITIHYLDWQLICYRHNETNPIEKSFVLCSTIPDAFNQLTQQHNVILKECNFKQLITYLNKHYIFVKAAGGIVLNKLQQELLIQRNNRWDIPKGMVESNETLQQAAIREICEETGLLSNLLSIDKLICKTYHIYDLYGGWHIKQTSWFLMNYNGNTQLCPQIEENISSCSWCTSQQRKQFLSESYSTLQELNSHLQ